MRASIRLAAALVAGGLIATPAAHALTKKEKACQAAIAKTGQAFVKAELTNRAKCKMAVAAGKKCDPTAKTNKNKAKLRKVIGKCAGVTLSNLGTGGCAQRGGSATGLADCLATGHTDAVASLINDQFGLVASEDEVVLQGLIIGSSLMAGSWAARYIVLRIPEHRFHRMMEAVLLLSGLTMVAAALF